MNIFVNERIVINQNDTVRNTTKGEKTVFKRVLFDKMLQITLKNVSDCTKTRNNAL